MTGVTATRGLSRTALVSLLAVCMIAAPVHSAPAGAAESGSANGFQWYEIQPGVGAKIAGVAELDEAPGDEILVDPGVGGFYVARGDGTTLWRKQYPGPMTPILIPDADGDGTQDVLAQTSRWNILGGRAVLLSGATGDVLWRTQHASNESGYGPPRAADLNGDGAVDLVLPVFRNPRDPSIETLVRSYFGPDFTTGWEVVVPGIGTWAEGNEGNDRWQSIAIGNIDQDATPEIAVGSDLSEPKESADGEEYAEIQEEGFLTTLDGESGQTKWSVRIGAPRRIGISDGSVVAFGFRSIADAPDCPMFECQDLPISGWGARYGTLSAHSGSDGSVLWSATFPGYEAFGQLLVGDLDGQDGKNEILISSARKHSSRAHIEPSLYAFSADGVPIWRHPLERVIETMTLVPREGGGSDVAYGTFAGWAGGNEHVGMVSGLTGAPVWKHEHDQTGLDAIDGVAVADLDGNADPEVVYASSDQQITSLSPTDGTLLFTNRYPGVWTAADAEDVNEDGELDIIGGGMDGLVRATSSGGQEIWATPVGGTISGLHLDAGSVLGFTLGERARAFSLDARTGDTKWAVEVGRAPQSGTSRELQEFGDLDGDSIDDVVVSAFDGVRWEIIAISGASGTILWRTQPAMQIRPMLSIIDGDIVLTSLIGAGSSWLAFTDPPNLSRDLWPYTGEPLAVAYLDGETGSEMWTARGPAATRPTVVGIGDLIVVSFDEYRRVRAYRVGDGSLAWELTFECAHEIISSAEYIIALPKSFGGPFCNFDPIKAFDQSGELHTEVKVPGGRLLEAAIAPGEALLAMNAKGDVSLVNVPALLSGRFEVLDLLQAPSVTGWLHDDSHPDPQGPSFGTVIDVTTTRLGTVALGVTDLGRMSRLYVPGELRGAWALLLPQAGSQ